MDDRLQQVPPRAAFPNACTEPTSDRTMLTADPTNRREFPEFPSVTTRTVILEFMRFVVKNVDITIYLSDFQSILSLLTAALLLKQGSSSRKLRDTT